MTIKKYTLLAFSCLIGIMLNAQVITKGPWITEHCPQYTSSGSNNLMATFFKGRLSGLAFGETYHYYITACSPDSIGKNYAGVGGSFFMDVDSPSRYVSNPSFTAGNFDSFTVQSPSDQRWFAFVPSTDAAFTAGKYVVPVITIKGTGASAGYLVRYALKDSIKVLSYSTSAGANNGTGVYGLSAGVAKNLVLLYDSNKITTRPLTIGMIEDDKLTSSNYGSPTYYRNNVDGVVGAWGGILPNTLAKGVRRIDRRDLITDAILHTNLDTNGVWLSVDTKNPSGGATSPIAFSKDEAALVPTIVEFTQPFISVNEDADSFAVLVRRRYSTEDTAKVNLNLIGGTATNNVDYNFPSSYQFVFAPGKERTDTFRFKIIDDKLTEGNEIITIKFKDLVNTLAGSDSLQSITIIDNDVPIINFTQTSLITREDFGNKVAKISIENGTTGTTTVEAFIKSKSPLTVIPNEFYLGINSANDTTVTFANGLANDTSDLDLFIVDESSIDAPDTIVIVLRNPSGNAILGPDSIFTLIVKDNDAPIGVKFITANQTVNENVGSIDLMVELINRNSSPSDFSLQFIGTRSTATEGKDFTFNPITKIYSFGLSGPDTMTINIPILDDADFEPNEVITMAVTGTVNATTHKPDTVRITIISEDKELLTASDAKAINSLTGVSTRIGENVKVTGVVHGFNRVGAGYEFTLIDATGGIQIASPSNVSSYTFTEKDSITVTGTIAQQNGVVQLAQLDTISKHNSNSNLTPAANATRLNEQTEQEIVKLDNIRFYDVSNWPASPLAANLEAFVYAINSTKDTLQIRIDAEGTIDGTTAPDVNKYYNVTGIGSQSDMTQPFLSNYYLDILSISTFNSPIVNFTKTAVDVAETSANTDNLTINFTNAGVINIGFELVDTKLGTGTPITDYDFKGIDVNVLPTVDSFDFKVKIENNTIEDGNRTIQIAIRNPKYGVIVGADSVITITIQDDETDNIINLKNIDVTIYPNPVSRTLTFRTNLKVEEVIIYNSIGKQVMFINGISNNEINISELPMGLYNLVLTIDGTKYAAQVVKN